MKTSFEQLSEVVTKPREWLSAWKGRTGRGIIGCFPMYIPEEVIHAAGMLPVTLIGGDQPITLAHEYLHSYLCHPVRANFDLALKGDLDYMDGLVLSNICEQAKRLSSLWALYHKPPFYYQLMLPKRMDSPASRDFLQRELERFKRALQTFIGKEIPPEAIKQSIVLYNNCRTLLHRLYRLRRQRPGIFKAEEVATIMTAAALMPKEEFNPLLARYLESKERERESGEGVRIVLWGNPCEDLEPGFAPILDELGARITDDDLSLGGRYFAISVKEEGDPLEALAEAHLHCPPCPTRHNPRRGWADYLLQVVKETGAKGIVVLLQKFCEIHAFEYPYLKGKLSQAGIPLILIETDHSGATARVKTRLEAFIEMLKGG